MFVFAKKTKRKHIQSLQKKRLPRIYIHSFIKYLLKLENIHFSNFRSKINSLPKYILFRKMRIISKLSLVFTFFLSICVNSVASSDTEQQLLALTDDVLALQNFVEDIEVTSNFNFPQINTRKMSLRK